MFPYKEWIKYVHPIIIVGYTCTHHTHEAKEELMHNLRKTYTLYRISYNNMSLIS